MSKPNPDLNALIHDARESMSNFDLNAILRGAQLTVVGGTRSRNLLAEDLLTCRYSFASFAEPGTLQV